MKSNFKNNLNKTYFEDFHFLHYRINRNNTFKMFKW